MNEWIACEKRGGVLLKQPKQVFLCGWEIAPRSERGQVLGLANMGFTTLQNLHSLSEPQFP